MFNLMATMSFTNFVSVESEPIVESPDVKDVAFSIRNLDLKVPNEETFLIRNLDLDIKLDQVKYFQIQIFLLAPK